MIPDVGRGGRNPDAPPLGPGRRDARPAGQLLAPGNGRPTAGPHLRTESRLSPGAARRSSSRCCGYGEHQRLEIIDAFLLLVPPIERHISEDPAATPPIPAIRPVLNSLGTSAVVPIFELLAQLLHDTSIPHVGAARSSPNRLDRKFLDYLLHNIGSPVSLRVLDNLRKLRIGALARRRPRRAAGARRPRPVRGDRIGRAGLRRSRHVSVAAQIPARSEGQPEGRRAACDALAEFHDRYLDPLVLHTLERPRPARPGRRRPATAPPRHPRRHGAARRAAWIIRPPKSATPPARRSPSSISRAFAARSTRWTKRRGRKSAAWSPKSIPRRSRRLAEAADLALALHQDALAGNGAGDGRRRRQCSTGWRSWSTIPTSRSAPMPRPSWAPATASTRCNCSIAPRKIPAPASAKPPAAASSKSRTASADADRHRSHHSRRLLLMWHLSSTTCRCWRGRATCAA